MSDGRQTDSEQMKEWNKARRDHSIIHASFSISGGGLVWPADPAVSPSKIRPGQRRSFRNPTTHLSKDDAQLGVWRHQWYEVTPGLLFTSTVEAAQKVRGWRRRPGNTTRQEGQIPINSGNWYKLCCHTNPVPSSYFTDRPARHTLHSPLEPQLAIPDTGVCQFFRLLDR